MKFNDNLKYKKIKKYFKNLLTNVILFDIIVERLRKVSSVGRASALQAEGHRFEPCTFHQGIFPYEKWLGSSVG